MQKSNKGKNMKKQGKCIRFIKARWKLAVFKPGFFFVKTHTWEEKRNYFIIQFFFPFFLVIVIGCLHSIFIRTYNIRCYGVSEDLNCNFWRRIIIILFDLIMKELVFILLPGYYILKYAEHKNYMGYWYMALSSLAYLFLMFNHDELLYGSF